MMKSLYVLPLLILPACLLSACITTGGQSTSFAGDNCKALSELMRDRNLNASVSAEVSSSGSYQENDKDHFTLPWVKGGTNKDKVSKERAALRKAYSQKDCAT